MQRIKGMVEVDGTIFRIERVEALVYDVIRIKDDVNVGAFRTQPVVSIVRTVLDPPLMHSIARAAIHGGKVFWSRRLPPV